MKGFTKGDKVKLTEYARECGLFSKTEGEIFGVVTSNQTRELIRVQPDRYSQPDTYHEKFWSKTGEAVELPYNATTKHHFKLRQQYKIAGLCRDCGKPAARKTDGTNYVQCDIHRARHREYYKEYWLKKKRERLAKQKFID